MKIGIVCILSLILVLGFKVGKANSGDTVFVTSHYKTTVVTDEKKGAKSYTHWAKFPSTKMPVRKITLNVSFGCPDNMRCADWDYMDRISILRQGGVNGKNYNYEIGRMLTPYGGAFAKTWQFAWEIDVTDFSLLLRDSVEIEYLHTGYEPSSDRGWAITVAFNIVEGPPAYEAFAITPVYDNKYAYGNPNNPINESLKEFGFTPLKQASFARLRLLQTGHGMDTPDNCSEFCNKYRELFFDGKLINKRNRWKKCGDNPLYPQAGTWLINRANWCPGDLIEPEIFDLPLKAGKVHRIKANMENYVSTKPSAIEVISAYLIQCKKPKHAIDAAVKNIEAPTNKDAFSRNNPIAENALVAITNHGSSTIHSLEISYGTHGFATKKYTWKGVLPSRKTVTISLPGNLESNPGTNRFMANIEKVNNKKDQYPIDNIAWSTFQPAAVHSGKMIVFLQTNKQAQHNGYTIKNSAGQIFAERAIGSLDTNYMYRDSLNLPPGNYTLALLDTASDGLEFWFNNRGGRGQFRLETKDGKILKKIDSDFGSSLLYHFKVIENAAKWSAVSSEPSVGLYPTRTTGKTTLDYFSGEATDVLVKIVTDEGSHLIEEHQYNNLKSGIFQYDLSYRTPQRYYVQVYIHQKLIFNKRLRVEEISRR